MSWKRLLVVVPAKQLEAANKVLRGTYDKNNDSIRVGLSDDGEKTTHYWTSMQMTAAQYADSVAGLQKVKGVVLRDANLTTPGEVLDELGLVTLPTTLLEQLVAEAAESANAPAATATPKLTEKPKTTATETAKG